MCGTCSCSQPETPHRSAPPPAPGPERIEPRPGSRQVTLERRLLAVNDAQAMANRQRFRQAGVRAWNLMSSPGSGKTALLERLARDWGDTVAMAALVGDLATDLDARRLQAAGLRAQQLSTGRGCHLDAAMVSRGVDALIAAGLELSALDWLLIENVGNLVCPAAFDLGEERRLVLLSVTEGEDKPLKYPASFRAADLVVITKIDLAAAVDFDRAAVHRAIARVAPQARVLETSARTGEGLEPLIRWGRRELEPGRGAEPEATASGPSRSAVAGGR